MPDRSKLSPIALLIVLCIFLGSAYLVIRMFGGEPTEVGRIFAQRSRRPAAASAGSPGASAPADSIQRAELPMVARASSPSLLAEDEPGPARAPASAPAAAASRAGAPARAPAAGVSRSPSTGESELSEPERSLVDRVIGKWNDASAAALGANPIRMFKLGQALMGYPRVVSALLNNPFVVHAFMGTQEARARCSSPRVLTEYLTNGKDPDGIRLLTQTLAASLRTPGSASEIAGSKLAGALLTDCPAIQSVIRDPQAIKQVVTADNGIAPLITNPALLTALSGNQAALGTFNAVQASMGGGQRQAP